MKERDVSKLPQWAQRKIGVLEANEKFANERREQAEHDMLERGRIELGDDKVLTWSLRVDGELEVAAYDGVLHVLPRAANTITLQIRRFGER